jgi:hypothetical protein
VVALIVYGSLYPWDFHSTQLAANPLWVLIHSWPTRIDRFLLRDIAVNVLIYMPVGVFGFLALRQNVHTALAVEVQKRETVQERFRYNLGQKINRATDEPESQNRSSSDGLNKSHRR